MVVIELGRDEIEAAINMYVKDKVLSYANKDDFELKIVQGKSASAKVTLLPVEPVPLSE